MAQGPSACGNTKYLLAISVLSKSCSRRVLVSGREGWLFREEIREGGVVSRRVVVVAGGGSRVAFARRLLLRASAARPATMSDSDEDSDEEQEEVPCARQVARRCGYGP